MIDIPPLHFTSVLVTYRSKLFVNTGLKVCHLKIQPINTFTGKSVIQLTQEAMQTLFHSGGTCFTSWCLLLCNLCMQLMWEDWLVKEMCHFLKTLYYRFIKKAHSENNVHHFGIKYFVSVIKFIIIVIIILAPCPYFVAPLQHKLPEL